MRICHVTPHLPPDQAANALLPWHLGEWGRAAGDAVSFVAHPPRAGMPASLPGPVVWLPSRHALNETSGREAVRARRLDSLRAAWRIWREAGPAIRQAEIVHIHSNGLLAEMAGVVARAARKPTVLTLYGTEIWHYRPKPAPDLFTRLYRGATEITFYSQGLLDYAREKGLDRAGLRVAYPPVAEQFAFHDTTARDRLRGRLGLPHRHLLVNVKRLHPLAGQRYLVEAMRLVVDAHPDTHLIVCGTGSLLSELQSVAEAFGVASHITFAGLVENALVARYCAASDLFVLPSMLEACPTVALEALATGTPVVSSDNPGGVELNALFGEDVAVVPRKHVEALALAIVRALDAPRRTRPATETVLAERFRPAAVDRTFREVYVDALERFYRGARRS
ncbi:MAG: glycosyltransferase family 4 protein [Vicinamibacteraceae bacterium]|nr:glycosyltransferase family 4 protein [Vicinamibacteraceae bacterium]